jgi:hypothetical protein
MNTEFDALEHQLSSLRPARLPATVRQDISREMERPANRPGPALWLFGHRAGLQVALAGALSLALVARWHWLPRSARPVSDINQTALADSNALLPSLAFLEARIAVTSQIGVNTVSVLRSPSILTNTQIRR